MWTLCLDLCSDEAMYVGQVVFGTWGSHDVAFDLKDFGASSF